MSKLGQSIIMLLIGAVVVRIVVTGEYLRYVKDGLAPFLVVSGALLLLIAAATMIPAARAEFADAPHDDHAAEPAGTDDDGHGHSHRGPFVTWLLVLPVFAIVLIAPPPLGSYTAARAGSATIDQTSSFAALPPGDPVPITLMEYATRALVDNGASMKGRKITLTGFLTPRPEGGFYLTRIVMGCCAADGRPIKIGLAGKLPSGLKADQWLQVDGEYTDQRDTNATTAEKIAFITVERHQRVAAPAQPYER